MGRSLWEDEAHLALNFLDRDFAGLMQPLDNIQAAPPLFLISVKCFNVLSGYGEKAFHALPFLFSLLTLPLSYFVAKDLTRKKLAAIIGFLACAVNLALIAFSSELKTYGIDVATYLILVWLAVSNNEYVVVRRNMLLGIAGCILILYSNVTFIVMFCIATLFLYRWLKDRRINLRALLVLVSWGIVYAIYYRLFIYHHPYRETQVGLYAFAFPTRHIFSGEFIIFIKTRVKEICDIMLYLPQGKGPVWVFSGLLSAGIIAGIRQRKYALLLLTLLPLLVHFSIAYLKIYPFWYRFVLYTIPGILILTGWGIYVIAVFIKKYTYNILGALVIIAGSLFIVMPSLLKFPFHFREIRPALDFINRFNDSKLYITTPFTLYKYYYRTGIAKNKMYEALEWQMSPQQYFESVAGTQSDYLLLRAADSNVDGYGQVVRTLREKGLIRKEFSYMTYTVDIVRPLSQGGWVLDYTSFDAGRVFDLNGKKVIALWDNAAVAAKAIWLPQGKYRVSILSKGTPARGMFPHISVMTNDMVIGDYTITAGYEERYFDFMTDSGSVILKVLMDNDLADPEHNEDRNAFIQHVIVRRVGQEP